MRLAYDLRPRLLLLQRCRVCYQNIDSPPGRIDSDRMEQRLFGAKKYAVCPSCGQTVENQSKEAEKNYRARYDRFIKRKAAQHVGTGSETNRIGGET